jgi:hypothetical protein
MSPKRLLIVIGVMLVFAGSARPEDSAYTPPECSVSLFLVTSDNVCVGEDVVLERIVMNCGESSVITYITNSFSDVGTHTITASCGCSSGGHYASVDIHVSEITNLSPSQVTICRGSYMDFEALSNPSNSACTPTWEVRPPYAGTFPIQGLKARFLLSASYEGTDATVLVSCGSQTRTASITVTNPFSIASQPISQVVCPGETSTFSVAVNDTGLSYQWRMNGLNLVDADNVSGATNSTLTVSGATTISDLLPTSSATGKTFGNVIAGRLYCYEASGCCHFGCGEGGCQYSDPDGRVRPNDFSCTGDFVIWTNATDGFKCPGLVKYSLVGKIGSQCIQLGSKGMFIAPDSGTLTLYFNDDVYWDNVGSWDVRVGTEGDYDVIVSSECGYQISSPATLSVATLPVITLQPLGETRYVGQSASFLVAANSSEPLSYQWRKNGTPISGATSTMFTLNNVAANDAGSYDVVVSNTCGMQTASGAATLTVVSDTDGDGLPDDLDANPAQYDHTPPSFTLTQPTEGAVIP